MIETFVFLILIVGFWAFVLFIIKGIIDLFIKTGIDYYLKQKKKR